MDITLLDALSPHPIGARVERALGPDVRRVHVLDSDRFAPCQGCFECWVAHPGTCRARDSANDVMRDIIAAEEVVWATTVRFGCWDALAKRALDKTIGLILPFFTTVDGETHHSARYPRYPRIGVVAVAGPEVSAAQRARFRVLVARNAINMQSAHPWVAFVDHDAPEDAVRAAVAEARAQPPILAPTLDAFPARTDAVGVAPHPDGSARRVVRIAGSARPEGESTSEHLGRAIVDRLVAAGWEASVHPIARLVTFVHPGADGLARALRRADLVLFAIPVYVDALPAVVLAALDRLRREDLGPRRPALLPIVQCGVPEIAHTRLALEVLADASDALGLGWAGHLAVGGGGALASADLSRASGVAWQQVGAIDAAAAALDRGLPLDACITEAFAHPGMSPAVYRLAGDAGWVFEALKHGALFRRGQRVFPEE